MPTSDSSRSDRIRDKLAAFVRGCTLRWQAWRTEADRTSESAYVKALASSEPSRRWLAAEGLGRSPLRSEGAVRALVDSLNDSEEFVRWQAVNALAAQEPGRVFPSLVAALDDPEPLRRAGAAQALGSLGGEAAALVLVKHLADPDPLAREAIAAGLGKIADPTTARPLVGLLEDPEPNVVRAAARSLGRIHDTLASVPLARALVRPGQPLLVRRAVAAALSHVPHPDAQPQLLAALSDPDSQVRGYAARALGHAGSEKAHGPLAALRSDQSPLIRGTVGDRAAAALSMLERRGRRTQAGTTDGRSSDGA